MKNEELIINGLRVDMSPDTRIVLNFKSNLLGDVSKITSSNSQTIQLPKTIRNRMIFDHASTPARNSSFPYQRHPAEYIRNGVKIISDAYAVMLSASENYEIALYWGEMTRFQKWIESGAKLNDLSFEDLYQIWSTTGSRTYCVDADPGDPDVYIDDSYFINADYDCGLGSMDTMKTAVRNQIWLHKFVSVRMILAKIQSDSGITFEFPDGYMSRTGYNLRGLFRSVAVALTTRKQFSSAAKNASAIEGHVSQGWCYYLMGVTFTMPASTYYTTENKGVKMNIWGEQALATCIKSTKTGRAKISFILLLQTSCNNSGYTPDPQLVFRKVGSSMDIIWDPRPTSTTKHGKSGGRYRFTQTFSYTKEFDIAEGEEIFIGFYMHDGYRFDGLSSAASISFTPPPVESEISLGEYFRAKGNFPDIAQLDFVKAICGLYGLYVVPSGVPNKIRFATLDSVIGNKANAVDWSAKVVRTADGETDPTEIKYTFGDYARRNHFKYKEDKTVQLTGNGDLVIDNEALAIEKDIITIPFSPSDEEQTTHTSSGTSTPVNVTLAVIPHYEMEDGEIKDITVTPRLVCMRSGGSTGNEAIAQFLPISFENMITLYYNQLNALLNSAVVLKERIRLTEFDLLNLDYTKPVFLKQYGRFYAIISVQTAEEYCNVELLQLPTAAPATFVTLLFSTDNGSTWLMECPSNWRGTLKVKSSPGRALTSADIGDIGTRAATSGTTRRMDLTDCAFISDTVSGEVNYQTAEEIPGEQSAAYALDNVGYIYFPEGIRVFGRKTFYYAHNVVGFTFPESVEEFIRQSFEYCYALQSVEFPAGVTYIGDVAFGHCYNLTTIRFRGATPPEIEFSAFHSAGSDQPGPKRIYVPTGTTAAYYAQQGIARIVDDFDFTIVEYDI